MKATISIITAISIVVALSAAGIIYPQTMEVVKVDAVDDAVYLMTSTGYIYAMSGTDDWEAGDLASLIMNSKGTPDITDDEIITARYTGFQRGGTK